MDTSGDLCDWEVLPNSDASDSLEDSEPQSDPNCLAIFQSDYFSLESNQKPPSSSDDASAASDNPSWIDPGSDGPFPGAGLWSDSGSDRSFSGKLSDGDDRLESQVSSNPFIGSDQFGANLETNLGIAIGNEKDGESDESTLTGNNTAQGGDDSSNHKHVDVVKEVNPKEPRDRVIWWKMPLELVKLCVFRVSPVWSLSVAAALVGVVILGRRLYKMKRKTQGLQLKLIIDDKRVSQFMSHAARLNEAFSLVRRVPVIRPSLPGPGAAPWPVMSMR